MNVTDYHVLFLICGLGIVLGLAHTILRMAGKEDFAYLATLFGFVGLCAVVLTYISRFYNEITSVFLNS